MHTERHHAKHTVAGRAARLLLAGLAGGLLLACSQTGGPVPDEQISLRAANPLQMVSPPPAQFPQQDPGGNPLLPRAFYGAPPQIPHGIKDMEISANANDCLDCHLSGDKDTPGIPPSHRIKVEYRIVPHAQAVDGSTTVLVGPDKAEMVSGTRYDCVLCHVQQAKESPPLVRNDFQSVKPTDARPDALAPLKSNGRY